MASLDKQILAFMRRKRSLRGNSESITCKLQRLLEGRNPAEKIDESLLRLEGRGRLTVERRGKVIVGISC